MSRPFAFCLLLLGLALGSKARGAPSVPVAEQVLPLGSAFVSELSGAAFLKEPRRPLQKGERLAGDASIETDSSEGSRLELRFADGSLLRIGRGTALTILPMTRQVALHRGRLLVAADRMLGSILVLTRRLSFLPEGTTYSVELDDSLGEKPPRLLLTVLEGAVCACPVAAPESDIAAKGAPRKAPSLPSIKLQRLAKKREMIILPGERLEVTTESPLLRPQPVSLTALLQTDPLIVGFSRRLPTFLRIDDLADQQRRHFLAGRNERLRREIFWKRPPRPPLKLPPLFSAPGSVTVRYE